MKQILKYGFISLTLVATLSSCMDTMDTHPASSFTSDVIWGSKSTVEAFINGIYDGVITGSGYAGSGSSIAWESRTPNSVCCSQVVEGIDGVATELGISTDSDFGTNFSSSLRKCNLVIENVEANEKLSAAEKHSLISQAKFLRGLIFFNQARKIGRFVPITMVLDTENPDAANIPMTSSVAESYKYVIEDLQAAVDGLPTENTTGLPTKWAAEVFLSRAA
ncbi:MAG: RagB/SusD family nutrient uptake outer membrane protein, partial [Bacteroides sp.]